MASHQVSTTNICLNEGWVEQDPVDIWKKVQETIAVTCEKLKTLNIPLSSIVAVGVTNQRETTLVWDKYTGKPLHNAISKLTTLHTKLIFRCLLKINNV